MKCEETFTRLYHSGPTDVSFCPYRICPVGAHVDHQLGKVTGFALDSGIHIAYHPKHNGVVELNSLQFDKRAQFHVASIPESKQGDWADYLRGATIELASKHKLTMGLAGVIEGSLPIGGLSSSAAVTIAFLHALAKVNEIHLSAEEFIRIEKAAENNYVGGGLRDARPELRGLLPQGPSAVSGHQGWLLRAHPEESDDEAIQDSDLLLWH